MSEQEPNVQVDLDLDLSQPDLVYRAPQVRPVAPVALSLLVDCGFDITDFTVEEELISDLALTLGLISGVLRVQCRSTGEDRIYSTGIGSAWMASILGDLDDGHFSAAARSARSVAYRLSATSRAETPAGRAEFVDTIPDVRLPSYDELPNSTPAMARRWGFASNQRRAQSHIAAGLGSF